MATEIPEYVAVHNRSYAPSLPRTLIPPCFINDPSVLSRWRNDFRRHAQQIYPHLWLGPLEAALNEQFLVRENITLLLGMAVPNTLSYACPSLTREFHNVPVKSPDECISFFQLTRHKIDEKHIKSNGSTLLFCESGNDKSATFAIAYVMETAGLDCIRSIQHVQSKRFCISVDERHLFQLKSYEPIWKARQIVLVPGRKKACRRRTDDHDDCIESSNGYRRAVAPFEDKNDGSAGGFESAESMQICA